MPNQWDPDVEFDDDLAFRLIDTQFREVSPAPMELIGRGWDNAVYSFGEWVFRFPQRNISAPLMDVELELLPEIAPRLPLPIPNPELAGEPALGYPFRWMGYRHLEGSPSCALPPTQAAPEQIAEFLVVLHGLTATPGVPGDDWGRADLAKRLSQTEERLVSLTDAGIIDNAPQIRVVSEELATSAPAADEVLVHGDLYPCHVLRGRNHLTGIIDWGDVHVGDPALDLSIGYSWFGTRERDRFFNAYLDAGGHIDADVDRRARFRSLYYGLLLLEYGTDVRRNDLVVCARRALAGAL